MKKFLLIIFVCLLCSINSFAQHINYLRGSNIKGNVVSIEEKRYEGEIVGSEIIKGTCFKSTKMTFSSIGNILEHETLDCQGKLLRKSICSYSKNGVIVKRSDYNYNTGVKNIFIVEFDKDFNIVNYYFSDENKNKKLSSTYILDNNGNDKEIIMRDDEGKVSMNLKFIYDNKDYAIEKIYEIKDWGKTTTKCDYDNNGNLIKSMVYKQLQSSNTTNIEFKTYTYKYDKTGNWIYKIEKSEGDKIEAEVTERIINYKPNVKK